MSIRKSWLRAPAFLGIGTILALPIGCQSPGAGPGGWFHRPPQDVHQAYRPTYAIPGTKPLYLNNYAGDDQSPMRPRRRTKEDMAPIATEVPPNLTVDQGSWNGD